MNGDEEKIWEAVHEIRQCTTRIEVAISAMTVQVQNNKDDIKANTGAIESISKRISTYLVTAFGALFAAVWSILKGTS